MKLVCSKCNARYEAKVKDPSIVYEQKSVPIACTVCNNAFLTLEKECASSKSEEKSLINTNTSDIPIMDNASLTQDYDEAPNPSNFHTSYPLVDLDQELGTDYLEAYSPEKTVFKKKLSILKIFAIAFLICVVLAAYWFIRMVNNETEHFIDHNNEEASLKNLSSNFVTVASNKEIALSALSFDNITVKRATNNKGEKFLLLKGWIRNLGTTAHSNVRIALEAYGESGGTLDERKAIPGVSLSSEQAKSYSIFEIIEKTEIAPTAGERAEIIRPGEALPFTAVFPNDAGTIEKVALYLKYPYNHK